MSDEELEVKLSEVREETKQEAEATQPTTSFQRLINA